jgi:hypothetical protein
MKTYNYESPSILARVFEIRNQCVHLFHNYLIDAEFLQDFICIFIKKYSSLESKIHYDKLNEEVKAYSGPIQLIHETFGTLSDAIGQEWIVARKNLISNLCYVLNTCLAWRQRKKIESKDS